jgi:sulfur carrier protein ThiS
VIVRVKCFTGLRRFAPDGRKDFTIELDAGAKVAHLLDRLGVPVATDVIAAVNGRRVDREAPLEDGDTLVLFTPMEGG